MNKQYPFQMLTPTDNVSLGIYQTAMDYVFENDKIRNIAVSGTYGAGKSSIIESYKKACPEKKFIHISLAHFDSKANGNTTNDNLLQITEAELEGRILNQLVHQINPSKIPLTHFKTKKNVDNTVMVVITLLITFFISIICFLRFHDAWNNMITGLRSPFLRWVLDCTTSSEAEFILGAAAIVLLGMGIYKILSLQYGFGIFKKLKIIGNEIEIFDNAKDSYFDKYLNEVLYIFEHFEADGIVFEDIDRYDSNLIFERLREINYLLNQRQSINGGNKPEKPVRFFYLLRDEIFKSKDRTKFFDFILPIVPVISGSNACDMFIQYFKEADLIDQFNSEFLYSLSLYVDDMRILKNIYNEFVIYYNRLNLSSLKPNGDKLLAMITYKNIFPKDFGMLQVGRGYVYTLFSRKKEVVRNRLKQIEKEINALIVENERIKSDLCNDIDELNSIYFTIEEPVFVDDKIGDDYKTRKEFVRAIMNSDNITRYDEEFGGPAPIDIDEEIKRMEQNTEYIERKQKLEKRNSDLIERNDNIIANLKEQMKKLEDAYLKDLITRDNEEDIFAEGYSTFPSEEDEFLEIKRSPYFDFIKYIIRNGYLDETYPDYMSYFYTNSITANDKIFLRSIADKKAMLSNYDLKDPDKVISRMRAVDFKEPESLNYKLLEQLLSDPKKYEVKLQNFMEMICYIRPVEFITKFLEENDAKEKLVKTLNEYWFGACEWILSTEEFSFKTKKRYVECTFRTSSENEIVLYNQGDELRYFVQFDPDFLSLKKIKEDTINRELKALDVKFMDINIETANPRLLLFVYENNLYEIKMKILQKMIAFFWGIAEGKNFIGKNFTIISSKKEEPLYSYITENMNSYIQELLSCTNETADSEEAVVSVLNCPNLEWNKKKAYITSSKTIISKFEKVEDKKLWSVLLEQNKVPKTIESLYDYYYDSGNGMDDCLVRYINSFKKYPILATEDLDKKYGIGAKQRLFYDIIKSNGIINYKYKAMVSVFEMKCMLSHIGKTSAEKIEILIQCDILEMDENNLKLMRYYYHEKCKLFILHNIEKYVEILNQTTFSSKELMQLLEERIDDKLKLRLLRFAKEPISIQNKKYSADIQEYIITNLYDSKDFKYLLETYSRYGDQMKSQILNKVCDSIENNRNIPYKMHSELLACAIQNFQIDPAKRRNVLIQQIEIGISKNDAKKAFQQLGLTEFVSILDGKRPLIDVTDENEQVLEAFLKKRWILRYKKEQNNPQKFRIFLAKQNKTKKQPDKIAESVATQIS